MEIVTDSVEKKISYEIDLEGIDLSLPKGTTAERLTLRFSHPSDLVIEYLNHSGETIYDRSFFAGSEPESFYSEEVVSSALASDDFQRNLYCFLEKEIYRDTTAIVPFPDGAVDFSRMTKLVQFPGECRSFYAVVPYEVEEESHIDSDFHEVAELYRKCGIEAVYDAKYVDFNPDGEIYPCSLAIYALTVDHALIFYAQEIGRLKTLIAENELFPIITNRNVGYMLLANLHEHPLLLEYISFYLMKKGKAMLLYEMQEHMEHFIVSGLEYILQAPAYRGRRKLSRFDKRRSHPTFISVPRPFISLHPACEGDIAEYSFFKVDNTAEEAFWAFVSFSNRRTFKTDSTLVAVMDRKKECIAMLEINESTILQVQGYESENEKVLEAIDTWRRLNGFNMKT